MLNRFADRPIRRASSGRGSRYVEDGTDDLSPERSEKVAITGFSKRDLPSSGIFSNIKDF
jgi:hypothetical protein